MVILYTDFAVFKYFFALDFQFRRPISQIRPRIRTYFCN
jgi:hypothetical protein